MADLGAVGGLLGEAPKLLPLDIAKDLQPVEAVGRTGPERGGGGRGGRGRGRGRGGRGRGQDPARVLGRDLVLREGTEGALDDDDAGPAKREARAAEGNLDDMIYQQLENCNKKMEKISTDLESKAKQLDFIPSHFYLVRDQKLLLLLTIGGAAIGISEG